MRPARRPGRARPTTASIGRAEIRLDRPSPLFEGLLAPGQRSTVWMSHGDKITAIPPGFRRHRPERHLAVRRHRRRGPPLSTASSSTPRSSTPRSAPACCRTSCSASAASPATGRCTPSASRRSRKVRAQVGTGGVICGLSGGVDSAVAALLVHEAIGDQLTCVFVDTGLLRFGEARGGGRPVPRPLQHPAGPCRRRPAVPRARSPASATPSRSARPSAPPSSTSSTPRPSKLGDIRLPGPGHALSRRDRERLLPRAPASPSSRTTMSAACPSA